MRIFFIILAMATIGSTAKAQNLQLSQSQTISDSISVTEMTEFLQLVGFQTKPPQEFDADQDSIKIIEAELDGGIFYFALRECSGPGVAAQCQLLESFGYFNGSGVTLSQVNTFNLTKSATSTAGLIPDGRGIISSKIRFAGGITPDNFGLLLALFFVDIDVMLNAISPGTLASVNFEATPHNGHGLAANDFRQSADIAWKVNSVGHNAPDFMNDNIRAFLDEIAAE